MANYFNSLPLRLQLEQLGKCDFMSKEEFADGVKKLEGKKIVILGCGAQGLAQGLNMRDSGLDISYAVREVEITEKQVSWKNATENNFAVGTFEEMIPQDEEGRYFLDMDGDFFNQHILKYLRLFVEGRSKDPIEFIFAEYIPLP